MAASTGSTDSTATALDPESRKPSTRSRSVNDISALSAPPARIEAAHRLNCTRARLALSVRQEDPVRRVCERWLTGEREPHTFPASSRLVARVTRSSRLVARVTRSSRLVARVTRSSVSARGPLPACTVRGTSGPSLLVPRTETSRHVLLAAGPLASRRRAPRSARRRAPPHDGQCGGRTVRKIECGSGSQNERSASSRSAASPLSMASRAISRPSSSESASSRA